MDQEFANLDLGHKRLHLGYGHPHAAIIDLGRNGVVHHVVAR